MVIKWRTNFSVLVDTTTINSIIILCLEGRLPNYYRGGICIRPTPLSEIERGTYKPQLF